MSSDCQRFSCVAIATPKLRVGSTIVGAITFFHQDVIETFRGCQKSYLLFNHLASFCVMLQID